MKHNYLFIILALVMFSACSKDDSISLKEVDDVCTQMDDIKFMKYCYDNFDVNKDGKVSMEEANAVKSIGVSNKGITSLKGLEYFINLTGLWCYRNQLTSLDLSNNTFLTELDCSENQLTSLDLSNNTALTELRCSENQLTSLDLSNNTALTQLSCAYNQLTSLDLSNNTALTYLYCFGNQFTSIDLSNNTALETLHIGGMLTTLDLSNNLALSSLNCGYSQSLTTVWLSKKQKITIYNASKNTTFKYKD